MTTKELLEAAAAADNCEKEQEEKNHELIEAAKAIDNLQALIDSEEMYAKAVKNGKVRREYQYGEVTVIELSGGPFGMKRNNRFVVPFGKYAFIDDFDYGLARVRGYGRSLDTSNVIAICNLETGTTIKGEKKIKAHIEELHQKKPETFEKWGIINEYGEEVLPLKYDEVWKFANKGRYTTKVVIDGKEGEIYLNDLSYDAPVAPWLKSSKRHHTSEGYDDYFSINDCYDYEGNFDIERYEDAILDGEAVDDW